MSLLRYLTEETAWEAWRAQAACSDLPVEWFYPTAPDARTPAIPVCESCPVRLECLEAGLSEDRQNGIWGGFTERQRILAKANGSVASLRRRARG